MAESGVLVEISACYKGWAADVNDQYRVANLNFCMTGIAANLKFTNDF